MRYLVIEDEDDINHWLQFTSEVVLAVPFLHKPPRQCPRVWCGGCTGTYRRKALVRAWHVLMLILLVSFIVWDWSFKIGCGKTRRVARL